MCSCGFVGSASFGFCYVVCVLKVVAVGLIGFSILFFSPLRLRLWVNVVVVVGGGGGRGESDGAARLRVQVRWGREACCLRGACEEVKCWRGAWI